MAKKQQQYLTEVDKHPAYILDAYYIQVGNLVEGAGFNSFIEYPNNLLVTVELVEKSDKLTYRVRLPMEFLLNEIQSS